MRIKSAIHLGLAAITVISGLAAQLAQANVTVNVLPQNPAAFVGANLVFNAQTTVTAGETITSYTWKESANGQPPFVTIPGATGSTLALSNIQLANSGSYFVSVTYNSTTNTGVTAVSTLSTLTVEDQARIVTQPASQFRQTGTSTTLTVAALGAQPLTYHWRENGVPLTDNSRVSGSSSSSLAISSLLTSDTGNYDVVVSNVFTSVVSQTAKLTVLDPPAIVIQPADSTFVTGDTATLSVTSAGTPPLTYQWFNGTNLVSNNDRVTGANTNILSIANSITNDSGSYTVVVSSPVGSVISTPANLLVLLPPVITSSTNATGQQGFAFHFVATATGSMPITFGADSLPDGLLITPNTGVISGTPTVSGFFTVTLYATNAATTASNLLYLNLITDVPGITSSLTNNGQQGTNFTYTITASNNPSAFTATGLPAGLNFDPVTGIISGPSLLSGLFPITITAGNQYGTDTEILMLNLATGAPVITSKLTAAGVENNTNFTYKITASNSPVTFGAIGLPLGLDINPATGIISGTLTTGGTNNIIITASNAYGTGSNTLVLSVTFAKLTQLAITDVTYTYSKPYLLDFSFSLRDDTNAVTNSSIGNAVVRDPQQLNVQCLEGILQDTNNQFALPIGNETAFILTRVINGATSAKLLKTFFVLDYSYSMFITPNAIDDMQASVEKLIAQEPTSAQFGVVEFNADYVPPAQVTGFTSDKVLLTTDIENTQSNYVQGNYAGTRFYDALATALTNFPATNIGEVHYLILMSDGYDDSSVLPVTTNNPTQADVIVSLATNKFVKIYCVGFGPNPNTNVLLQLTSQTGGHYYAAATPADLATQFSQLLKDVSSQYLLRWATLQRAPVPFQPMFTVTTGGVTASYNTNFDLEPTNSVDMTTMPPTTNSYLTNISLLPLYNPMTWAGNVQQGVLNLVPDSDTNVSSITLHANYVPRYVREFQIHYRANYPCVPSLLSDGPGQFLSGWTLSQTNDATTNGQWLTITSPSPSNVLSSLPYGIMGDIVKFQFNYQALPTASNAFAFFTVDNSIYSNLPPSGQSFALMITNQFVTNLPPTPPFGTPIPWLISYGFTNDFTNAELLDPNNNGLTVWQDYIAGLNPKDTNSIFKVLAFSPPLSGLPPDISFNSALGRVYRVDASTSLGSWVTIFDGIPGTGQPISVQDNRNLSGVNGVFYRVVVSYP